MSNYTMSPVVNGEKKQMIVKVGDTLPIGTEVDYDGTSVPNGWEEVEKNILWENPNPSNSFAGQTITLSDNISNYDDYEVVYIYSTGSTRAFSSRLPKTEGTLLLGFVSYISRRGVSSPSGTTMQIDDCTTYITYGSNTTTTNNGLLIPIKIIGYKKQIKKIAPVTPANGLLENTYGTSQTNGYSQEYINGIIETGSNANGNYIKYNDGTLICYMKKRISNIAIGTAFGSMYINDTDIIFTFPQQFTERPTFNVNVADGSTGLILNYTQSTDTRNYSDGYRIARPNTAPAKEYLLNAIVIGKWK